jgi:hypothetical protein
LVTRVSELGRDAPSIEEVIRRSLALIAERVSFDCFCAGVFDPVARLPSWQLVHSRVTPAQIPRWGAIEVSNPRYLWYAADAARAPATSRLSDETKGALERSARYQEIFRHVELKHDLRVMLRAGGLVWGNIALVRDAAAPDFAPERRVARDGCRGGLAALAPQRAGVEWDR